MTICERLGKIQSNLKKNYITTSPKVGRRIFDFQKNITINRLFPHPLFQVTEKTFSFSLVFFSYFCKFCGLNFTKKNSQCCLLNESEGLNLSQMMIVFQFLFHHIENLSNQKASSKYFFKKKVWESQGKPSLLWANKTSIRYIKSWEPVQIPQYSFMIQSLIKKMNSFNCIEILPSDLLYIQKQAYRSQNYYYMSNEMNFTIFYLVDLNQFQLTSQEKKVSANQNQPQIQSLEEHQLGSQSSPEALQRENLNQNKENLNKLYQRSAKKNSQHNLVSQLSSFIRSRVRSQAPLKKIANRLNIPFDVSTIKLLYSILNEMFKCKKNKYHNLEFLKKIGEPSYLQDHYPRLVKALKVQANISLKQFCCLFRKASLYYLQSVSPLSILTSKKLRPIVRKVHLQKQRELIEHFSQ